LEHRAKLDGNDALKNFCHKLETACVETVDSGKMTKDLAACVHGGIKNVKEGMFLHSEEFLDAIKVTLDKKLAKK